VFCAIPAHAIQQPGWLKDLGHESNLIDAHRQKELTELYQPTLT
jgi:hypothetical protein